MTLAPQELENTASRYAAEAIKLDSQGSHSVAILSYQRASDALVRLVEIYPEYKLNRVYLERASAYQNRIKALQMANGLLDDDNQSLKELNSIVDNKNIPNNKNLNSLYKPNVTNVSKIQNKSLSSIDKNHHLNSIHNKNSISMKEIKLRN